MWKTLEKDPPCLRHWDDLTLQLKAHAATLDYDEDSWYHNDPRTISWHALMKLSRERAAAFALGFSVDTWNFEEQESSGETATFTPRLEPAKTLLAVHYLLDNHADEWQDPAQGRAWWETWASTHPTTVEDVVHKPEWEWPSNLHELNHGFF